MINIYIDADACPVKSETLEVSYRHKLNVFIVSNQWLRLEVGARVQKIVVPQGADEADDWIAEHADKTSICITADILLAKRCLDAGATVINPNGKSFTLENIGMALAMRELNQQIRETNQSQTQNASFTKTHRSSFLQALEQAIQKLKSTLA